MREQLHKLVDDLFDLRQALVGEVVPPEARRHFRQARREVLLGIRAAVDHALARLAGEDTDDEEPRQVPIEG